MSASARTLIMEQMSGRADQILSGRNFRVFVHDREVAVSQVRGLATGSDVDRAERAYLVLRRALGGDRTLFFWCDAALRGDETAESTVYIDQYDAANQSPVNTWALVGARPVRWSGPQLDALADGVAIEELELTFARVLWLDEPGARISATQISGMGVLNDGS